MSTRLDLDAIQARADEAINNGLWIDSIGDVYALIFEVDRLRAGLRVLSNERILATRVRKWAAAVLDDSDKETAP